MIVCFVFLLWVDPGTPFSTKREETAPDIYECLLFSLLFSFIQWTTASMYGWIIKKQWLDRHSLPWPVDTSFAASHPMGVGSIALCTSMWTVFECCRPCPLQLQCLSVLGPHNDVAVVVQLSKCNESRNCTLHCNKKQDYVQCSHCKELGHALVVVCLAKSILAQLWISFYSREWGCIHPYLESNPDWEPFCL